MRVWILAVVAVCLARLAWAAPMLATTHWPPYVDEKHPAGGSLGSVVMTTMARVAPGAGVAYFPWRRAVLTGLTHPDYIAYFPEYDNAEVRQRCMLSRALGRSPVGFAYRAGSGFDWQGFGDLKRYLIGTVAGYINQDSFDAMARRGELKLESVSTDAMNIQKLLARRVDAIVIDRAVLDHALATQPAYSARRETIAFHPRLLQLHTLHVCFRPTPEGQALQAAFDRALEAGLPAAREPSRP
jgi:polar amino acid transport system substrate-binding protein